MKRFFLVFISSFLVAFLGSCNNGANDKTLQYYLSGDIPNYRFDFIHYEVENNYWVEYPVIRYLAGNNYNSEKINKIIKDNAFQYFEFLNDFIPGTYKIQYDIKLANTRFSSILFSVYRLDARAVIEYQPQFVLNIDLETGELWDWKSTFADSDSLKTLFLKEENQIFPDDNQYYTSYYNDADIQDLYFGKDRIGAVVIFGQINDIAYFEIPYQIMSNMLK